MQDVSMFKIGQFHKRHVPGRLVHMRLKTEQVHHIFFKFQFDTTTLIIPSFRMTKVGGCKENFKSDLLRKYLLPDRIYMQYYGVSY